MGRSESADLGSLSILLGSLLNDPTHINSVADRLRPDDVLDPKLHLIYKAMWDAAQDTRCDLVSTTRLLRERGELEEAGGVEFLSGLTQSIPRGIELTSLTRAVIEDSWKQRIVTTCSEAIADVGEGKSAEQVTEAIEHRLFELHASTARNPLSSSYDGAINILDDTVSAAEGSGRLPIPTGFAGLDAIIDGFYRGELVVVGARPSIGKSSLGLDFCYNAALGNHRSAFFSCEMEKVRVWRRLLSKMTGIDSRRIRKGDLSAEEWAAYAAAVVRMRQLPIHVDDTSGITPGEVRAKCRRLQMEQGLDLVVIDYVQIMQSGMKEITSLYNENAELTFISKMVKDMARELDVPVVMLSQLSRKPEDRRSRRPVPSDLRGSGSLEQDADTILFPHREDQLSPNEKNIGKAELIVAKSRDGDTGIADATFIRHLSTFVNTRLRTSKRG